MPLILNPVSWLPTLETNTKQVNISLLEPNIFNVQFTMLQNYTRKRPLRKNKFYLTSTSGSPNLINYLNQYNIYPNKTLYLFFFFFITATCLEMLIQWVRVSRATGKQETSSKYSFLIQFSKIILKCFRLKLIIGGGERKAFIIELNIKMLSFIFSPISLKCFKLFQNTLIVLYYNIPYVSLGLLTPDVLI